MTMRESLTGDDLYSYVILLQSENSRKKYLLCEGESDCAVLDPHLMEDMCETIPGYGNNSVVEAIRIVTAQRTKGVAALIDRDWSKDGQQVSPLAAQTDHYDIDATIFYSGNVCQRVVSTHCNRDAVKKFLSSGGWDSPIEPATALALPIGVLRKLNQEQGWGIRCGDTPFDDVAFPDASGIDIEKAVLSAISRSKKPRVSQADAGRIASEVAEEMLRVADPATHCCGHDLNSALSFLMRRKWGGERINKRSVEKAMRAAFSCVELTSTKFHAGLSSAYACSRPELFTCLGVG
ncbi:hypothetical protein [Streptomyces sp. NPDC087297]|uniref:hypothetical protein n=1 Tax=Streptomyces sp. NPDC087297 TaxID=3365778 RepID=UPI00382EEECD